MRNPVIQFLPPPAIDETLVQAIDALATEISLITGTSGTWDVGFRDSTAYARVFLGEDGGMKYEPIDPKDFYAD
ncbi:MAG TPA: hypothetical protein VFI87_06370 [Hyphomicrobiaceae bacterium]|nr:hypothetical protein [Hyphomicrobiaceae bacterium]